MIKDYTNTAYLSVERFERTSCIRCQWVVVGAKSVEQRLVVVASAVLLDRSFD